jgi:hypothetical protein
MGLYLVERDLRHISVEQLRLDQKQVAFACAQLKTQGKNVRYISSAAMPADARVLDLFGAAGPELIQEAHAFAGVLYVRIVEILDLTPNFLPRSTSWARRSLRQGAGFAAIRDDRERTSDAMTVNSSSELARWLGEGQRLFRMCLDVLESSERLQVRNETLESENSMLREEVTRLRHRVEGLQADRSEMVAAFNDLAGHVTQVVDHILLRSEDGESDK